MLTAPPQAPRSRSQFDAVEIGSVARVEVSARDFNWQRPYQKGDSYQSTGSASLFALPASVVATEQEKNNFYLLTAFHVVENAERIWSTFVNVNGQLFETTLVGACPELDVALLRIESLPDAVRSELKRFALGDSDTLQAQQPVAAAGFPFGQQSVTIVEGVLSGRQDVNLQTTAPINAGNSGGPLFDLQTGAIMGVVVSGTENAQGMNYAVPSKQIAIHLPAMMRNRYARLPSFNILTNLATPTLLASLGCPPAMLGSFVRHVYPSTPFFSAGMRSGDVLTALKVGKETHRLGLDSDVVVTWWAAPVTVSNIEQRLRLGDEITIEFWSTNERRIREERVVLDSPSVKKIRYHYKQFERVEYEAFGGLVVMELTENHIEYGNGESKHWRRMFTFLQTQEPERMTEPLLVVTDVLAESSLRVLLDKTIGIADVVTHVNGTAVASLQQYRKALHAPNGEFIVWRTRDGMETALEYKVAEQEHARWRRKV